MKSVTTKTGTMRNIEATDMLMIISSKFHDKNDEMTHQAGSIEKPGQPGMPTGAISSEAVKAYTHRKTLDFEIHGKKQKRAAKQTASGRPHFNIGSSELIIVPLSSARG